jgi:hypothetical protein
MRYLNVGALINDKNAPTKKALREAMKSEPERVTFYATSMFDAGTEDFAGNDLPAGVSLSVVGPDPERSRKWYATVTPNGKVT